MLQMISKPRNYLWLKPNLCHMNPGSGGLMELNFWFLKITYQSGLQGDPNLATNPGTTQHLFMYHKTLRVINKGIHDYSSNDLSLRRNPKNPKTPSAA